LYLSKLEILGFKSFANKTQVNFNKGITSIVGPNGCGKTNIVDAIRWVLGEQKSSTLRSDKMESVIFNGSRTKKPMGMSEVSLTLVNDKGKLPSEYSEVTITRRIFRSGESEYLLNKNLCRLKDITSLFMDTGVGANAYSVIELKMVETILSSKAEERRRLFEEAAGVNKYKLRRKLSLKKLDEVKVDLARVNDIVSEVEKSVKNLEKQAKRAEKYKILIDELKEKEIKYSINESYSFALQFESLTLEKSELDHNQAELDIKITEYQKIVNEIKDEIIRIESTLREKRESVAFKTEKVHALNNTISVTEERKKSGSKSIVKYRDEIEELKIEIEETEFEIEDRVKQENELSGLISAKETEIAHLNEDVEARKKDFDSQRNQIKEKNDSEAVKIREVASRENDLKTLHRDLQKLNVEIERTESHLAKLKESLSLAEDNIQIEVSKQSGLVEQITNLRQEIEQRTQLRSDLTNRLNGLKEKEHEEKTLLSSLNDKIDFFQDLLTNYEGISQGLKKLLEDNTWKAADKVLLADTGTTDEKFRDAIESAVKNNLNNLLIKDSSELQKAVKYLRENDQGKAAFVLLRKELKKRSLLERLRYFGDKRLLKKLESEKQFVSWADGEVKADKKWKPYYSQLLAGTVVTKTINDALELFHKYPNFSFTTLEGDFINSNGTVLAGSRPKPEETVFGRKQLLQNLKGERPRHEKTLEQVRSEIKEIEEQLSGIETEIIIAEEKQFSSDLILVEKSIAQFEFEKQKTLENIENSAGELSGFKERLADTSEEIRTKEEEISQVRKEKAASEKIIKELESQLRVFEKNFNTAISRLNEEKVALERLKGLWQNNDLSLKNAGRAKQNILAGISRREKEIETLSSELTNIDDLIEDYKFEYDEIHSQRQTLYAEEAEIERLLNTKKIESSENSLQLDRYKNEKISHLDKLHQIDLKTNEISYRLRYVKDYLKEEYDYDLDFQNLEHDENFPLDLEKAEIHKLKESKKNFGMVNLLAFGEYEKEKERMDFLLKQRDDLINSEKDLVETIAEINTTAQRIFIETFEQIRANFRQIFQSLFSEDDEADLLIEEDQDPLEAKIEIVAKPRGKRPTNIELLSGGEKTLTATALLFAIYLVKPSPFCILDEVDAPLDDANVDRFTNLLDKFSNNTQFIVVTHNKRTMEAAETLYGVTMQEEGVSKIAAVRFSQDFEIQK